MDLPIGFTHWIHPVDSPHWIYPCVLWLEELCNASHGAPEVLAVPTGAPWHGQVLCSVDEVETWLRGPQGSQVVAGVAAQHYEAPGKGISPNGSCGASTAAPPALGPHKLMAHQPGPCPRGEQGQELGISAQTAPGHQNLPLSEQGTEPRLGHLLWGAGTYPLQG